MCEAHFRSRALECQAYHLVLREYGSALYAVPYGILCFVEAVQRVRYEVKYNISCDFDHDRFKRNLRRNGKKYTVNLDGYIEERSSPYDLRPLFEVTVEDPQET